MDFVALIWIVLHEKTSKLIEIFSFKTKEEYYRAYALEY